MMVDSDVLIWYMRGNERARRVIEEMGRFSISAVTYMEIIQGMRNSEELKSLKRFMLQRGVDCLPLDSNITDRAIYFMERYSLSHGMRLADALIAATADIRGEGILTANATHYKMIPGLTVETFRPGS